MSDTVFRYTKEIDSQIHKAVAETMNTTVRSSIKIDQGEVNHVYKVVTDNNTVVVRVFRHAHWPEEGKLPWIEKQLILNEIPHAKTIFYSRDSTYFPHGLMISEYITGKSGSNAILDGDVSFEVFHEKLASLLAKVNSIQIEKYGQVNNGKGQFNNFLEYRINKLPSRLDKLQGVEGIDETFKDLIINTVTNLLQPFESRFTPALVHGDPTPDNSIYTPEGNIILIDWDGALSETWLRDYSWLTYWGSHLSKYGDIEERKQKIRESFMKAYGPNLFSEEEIRIIEKALHILQAVDLLPYYYSDHQNPDGFIITKNKLVSLLET